MKRRPVGFTLIELLVVITIIAVLSGVAMVSFSAAGKGARDARRKTDLETIRQALVMYRSDNGCYPDPAAVGNDVIAYLGAQDYLSEPLPEDPKNDATYFYTYTPSIIATCTNANDSFSSFELSVPLEKDPTNPYTVTSPN